MQDEKKPSQPTPDLTDVEPGSDADEMPVAEPGQTPPDPNKKPEEPED